VKLGLTDSHAHLDSEDYADDLDAVLRRAGEAGVERIVLVGLWKSPGNFGNALALSVRDPGLFSATVGIHPHDAAHVPEADWAAMERLAGDPHIVGIGETGLDFHYDHSPRPSQIEAFRRSIAVAKAAGKPAIVHVREADEACAKVIAEEGLPAAGGVIHCFTGDWDRARAYLDLGLHLSVGGVVTFKSADNLRDAVARVPLDRLLIETDCPYLAPVPHRGKRNEPAYLVKTAERVAEIQSLSVKEVAQVTTENACRLFGI
jgi:TatD DNase family protein